ncbi:MAG: tetratricopeptide repeat protein [Polyangiales bacterium]
MLLAAVLLATASLWDGSRARLCGHRLRRRPILFVAACALGAAFTFATARPNSATEFVGVHREELGRRVWMGGAGQVVDLPRELGPRDRTRIVDDQISASSKSKPPSAYGSWRVHAFIFRSTAEKKRLMGAGSTHIAKPWRNQVYSPGLGLPASGVGARTHPRHRGQPGRAAPFDRGNRRRPMAEPGLIEGHRRRHRMDVRDGMTPHQWARTMLELDVAPPLTQVFGLGFPGNASSQPHRRRPALRFIADTRGMATVRRAYVLGDGKATGTPLTAFEHEWHTFLATVPVDDGAMGLARIRLSERGIFSAVCPHQLAVLEGQLGGDLGAHDDRGAVATCEKILSFDPSNTNARALYATSLAGMGRITEAEGVLKASRAAPAPTPPLHHARSSPTRPGAPAIGCVPTRPTARSSKFP